MLLPTGEQGYGMCERSAIFTAGCTTQIIHPMSSNCPGRRLRHAQKLPAPRCTRSWNIYQARTSPRRGARHGQRGARGRSAARQGQLGTAVYVDGPGR